MEKIDLSTRDKSQATSENLNVDQKNFITLVDSDQPSKTKPVRPTKGTKGH